MEQVTVRIETGAYNARRYSKPWIAQIDFTTSGAEEYTWGNWVGRAGEAGCLIIKVAPGAIVARGQKDLRGRGEPPKYYIVQADGGLGAPMSKVDVYTYYSNRVSQPKENREALVAERERLQARITEIDALLEGA